MFTKTKAYEKKKSTGREIIKIVINCNGEFIQLVERKDNIMFLALREV